MQVRAHVHSIANGIAYDRMWPVDAPGKAVTFRRSEHFVFLRVVEIIDIEPRLVLPKWCRDRAALAIGFERSEIVLEASHKCDVLDRAGIRQCIQQVAHHGRVDKDILCLGLLPQPCADENMRRTQIAQGRTEGRRIQQISGDRQQAGDINWRPACQPYARHPRSRRCRPRLLPTMPVAPTTSAELSIFLPLAFHPR